MNLLEEWNESDALTEYEKEILSKRLHHGENVETDWDNAPYNTRLEFRWQNIRTQYFDLMPNCGLDPDIWHLNFSTCCSNFIRELFNKHVDNDTLVISSDCEHPTVKECLSKCKNTLILGQHQDIRTFNLNKIYTEIVKYKKVFVYIIGMRNDTGEITPQSFMETLKNMLEAENKEHIIVLDDVQGMFFIPRDYTMYDYVLGTGHVAVPNFDMGIMISKEPYDGNRVISWGEYYLEPLKIVLKRLKKLYNFRYCCNKYFAKFMTEDNVSQALSAPHIFYLQNDKFKVSPELSLAIEKVHTLIMPNNTYVGGIRMRALGFITDPIALPKALKVFEHVLNNNGITEDKVKEFLNA